MDLKPKYTLGRKKLTVGRDDKGKRTAATNFCAHTPLPKKPRTRSSSAQPFEPHCCNELQKERYELFQGLKYICGKKIDWDAYASADFCPKIKKLLEDMD